MVVDLALVLGIIGMLFILVGFFMTQTHYWSQDDLIYDVTNLIGSLLLVYYGVVGHAWPFVILNTVWAMYSLKDVILDTVKKRKPVIRP